MSKNISQLPAATLPLTSADILPIFQAGATKQAVINFSRVAQNVTVGVGGVASITLTLPTGFTHAEIKILGRGSAAAETALLQLTFNNDSGANYEYEQINAVGATVTSSATTAANFISPADFVSANATASYASHVEIFINSYLETTFFQPVYALSNSRSGNVNTVSTRSGIWKSTTAINLATLALSSGSFIQGTVATLTAE